MAENRFYSASIDGNISTTFIIPTKKYRNQFAISDKLSVRMIKWDGKASSAKIVRDAFTIETRPEFASNNYNIAKASPKHHFYGGTYGANLCANSANAAVYRYTKCLGVKRLVDNLIVTSGMDWNMKEKKFYFIDTCNFLIREYDWNPKTEEICKNLKNRIWHIELY